MISVLGGLGRDLFGVGKAAEALTGKLSLLRAVAIGTMSAIAGREALRGMGTLVSYGDKLVEQQAKLAALGVKPPDVERATEAAYAYARSIPGTDPAHNLAAIRELRSVLTDVDEAIAAAPVLLRTQFSLGIYSEKHGTDLGTPSLIKAMDIKGAFVKNGQLDVESFNQAMQAAEAAPELTNGLLTRRTLYRFTRLADPAAAAMSATAYLKDFTEVMLGLGPTGGRGLQQAARTLMGGQQTKAEVQQLEALELLRPQDVTAGSGHYTIKTGALKGFDSLLSRGFVQWFHDVVEPALAAHGGADASGVLRWLSAFPATVQRVFSFLHTNWAQIGKFGAQFDERTETDANTKLQDGSLRANLKDFRAAWDGPMQALGAPLVKQAIGVLKDITSAILGVENMAAKHQTAVLVAGDIIADAGSVGTAFGLFAAGTAAASALATLAAPMGSTARAAGIVALGHALPSIPRWVIDMAAGASAGAALGTAVPGVGTAVGAVAGGAAGLAAGLMPAENSLPQSAPSAAALVPDWIGGDHSGAAARTRPGAAGTADDPVHVIVQNHDAVAAGVSAAQSRQISRPPSGPTQGDVRMDLPMPGFGVLVGP